MKPGAPRNEFERSGYYRAAIIILDHHVTRGDWDDRTVSDVVGLLVNTASKEVR